MLLLYFFQVAVAESWSSGVDEEAEEDVESSLKEQSIVGRVTKIDGDSGIINGYVQMTLHEVKLIIGGSEVSLFIQCPICRSIHNGRKGRQFLPLVGVNCIRNQQYRSISDVTSAFMFSWCES